MNDNLLNVLGVEDNENVWSNIYAYLLNPRESHGMGDKFMQAFVGLLKSRNNSIPDFYNPTIQREVKVNNDKEGRIDILIRDGHNCLIIENKVYHNADNNPFQAYYNIIRDSVACKYIVIITLQREEYLLKDISIREFNNDDAHNKLINVTHCELVESFAPIVKCIANSKVKFLLEDFISNINNRTYPMNDLYEFFSNHDEINRHAEIARITKEYLYDTLSDKYFIKAINNKMSGSFKELEEVNSDWKPIRVFRKYIRLKFSGSNKLLLRISLETIWNPKPNEKPKLTITLQPDGEWFELARNMECKIRELVGKHPEFYCNPIENSGWWHCAETSSELRTVEITDRIILQKKALELITNSNILQLAEGLYDLLISNQNTD